MSNTTLPNVPWGPFKEGRLGLIDADGILYAAALQAQTVCDGEVLQLADDEEVYRNCVSRIERQVALLGDETEDRITVFVALSSRGNFRKAILPSYKGNRSSAERPVALDALRARIMDAGDFPWHVATKADLEADDICGILATEFQAKGWETCIVSPDKDLLSIPGMVITPAGVFSEVTKQRADYWHLFQTLTGDTVDNYKGCPGVGPAKAEALLEACALFAGEDVWDFVVSAFEDKGLTEEDALVQARVARILRNTDWDADKKEVILWDPRR